MALSGFGFRSVINSRWTKFAILIIEAAFCLISWAFSDLTIEAVGISIAIVFVCIFYSSGELIISELVFGLLSFSYLPFYNSIPWQLYVMVGEIILGLISLYIKKCIKSKRLSFNFGYIGVSLIILVILSFISSIVNINNSIYSSYGFLTDLIGLAILVIYLLIANTSSKADRHDFMSTLFYLMSLIVILQVFMINKGVLNRSTGEIKIMYLGWGTKNVVSIALEITLPFICYILGKYKFRLDCYLLLFIDYVLIFISDSRGGIVTSILMLPLLSFIVVSRASRNKIHDFILFLCFFTFILISAIYFIPSVKESFIRLLNMRDDISGRGEIWQRCINYFKASPIFGGSMSCLFDMFQVYIHGENIGIWLCHNTFFTFLASLGAAGVLAYAFNLFESFFNLIRSKTGLMLPISGFLLIGLIHGIIDNTFFSIVYMLPFIILMSGERKKYSFKRDKKPSLTY